MVGVGIIACDHMGRVLASTCYFRLQLLILEGDALEVVMALQRDDEGAGYYGNLIVDTMGILTGFGSWVIQHVRRDGNKAAHHLAKLVVSNKLNHV